MNRLDKGFEVAFAAALLSKAPRAGLKMGAALYSGSRLLSIGCNLYDRTHPNSGNPREFLRTVHAEHAALLRRQHYEGDTNLILYVARRRANGEVGCSKPCKNCLELCRVAGVNRVRYFDHAGLKKEMVL